jgi:fumarate reductase iron-sulfur subunit
MIAVQESRRHTRIVISATGQSPAGRAELSCGPAAIALAQRYNLDSRDEGAHERMEVLSTAEGVWACTFVGECTTACPKGVDPAGAIQRYKLTAATESLRSFLLPWRSA